MHVDGSLLSTDVCNPDQGTVSIREKANAEFRDFVKNTYEGLYEAESKILSAKSSLSVFARFDIGLVVNSSDRRVQYFVNEVERTQTTSLWTNRFRSKVARSPAGILGASLAETFYAWLHSISNPYTV
jgi:hypothetical protein